MSVLRTILSATACAVVALGADAETAGFWVFNGTPDSECPDNTVIQNLVDGSVLRLVAGVTNRDDYVVSLPKYVADVPHGAIYSDRKFTNRIAVIGTSMRICEGSANTVGSYLSITNLGSAVMENGVAQDFTIEMFVRPDKSYKYTGGTADSQRMFAGIGKGRYCIALHGDYTMNSGSLSANDYSQVGVIYSGGQSGWGGATSFKWMDYKELFNGGWHHYALVYSSSTKTLSCFVDYGNASSSNGGVYWEEGVPMTEDTAFKILGKFYYSHFFHGANVAAIRITKGALDASSFMHLAGNYDENPVQGWWRFENGSAGGEFASCTNEVGGQVLRQLAKKAGYGSNTYTTPPKLFVSNATNKASADGNDRQNLMVERSSNGWGIRMDYKNYAVLFVNKITNVVTGAQSSQRIEHSILFPTGKWHHVAVVYDDESSPKTLTCFVDYEQKTQIEFAEGEALPRATDGILYLAGVHVNNANTTWFGSIDEFRVSRGALAPEKFLKFSNRTGVILIVE